jgi:hypothetical protein
MNHIQFQVLQVSSAGLDAHGPLVYLSGRSAGGQSVVAVVKGTLPYLCVKLEHGLLDAQGKPSTHVIGLLLSELGEFLNTAVGSWGKYKVYKHDGAYNLVRKHQVIEARDYYGYSPGTQRYLKIYFGSAQALTAARFALLEVAGAKDRKAMTTSRNLHMLFPGRNPEHVQQCLLKRSGAPYGAFGFTLGEANIEHHNQFCADAGVSPGKWVSVTAASTWDVRKSFTRANVELHVDARSVSPAAVDGSAPIRTLAFDLETYCTDLGNGATKFYNGDDPQARILCISAVVFNYTDKEIEGRVFAVGGGDAEDATAAPRGRVVSWHPTTDNSAELRVEWFATESKMIVAFLAYIGEYDPDVVTGWNTMGSAKSFDWMFLFKRCRTLRLMDALQSTGRWGSTKFHVDDKTGEWKERARLPIVMQGRVMHDMMVWVKKNKNLREYNLNFVAESFGCGEKDDVSYNQIDALSRTHAGRVKLAVYCELDSRLVCKLMLSKSLDPIGKSVALSAITGCPLEDLIFKGSMNSLRLCLLRVSHQHNFVLSCPTYTEPEPDPVETDVVDEDADPTSRYQVRTVQQNLPNWPISLSQCF